MTNSKNEENTAFTDVNGILVVVPESFERILPVSPYKERFDFEICSFLGLKNSLSEGEIAFDVGSSYGVMSVLMAKLVGKNGLIYSFEANSEAIDKATELVKANHLEDNIKLLNLLVGERTESEVDFYAIPGTRSVASSANPEILENNPDAIRKKVNAISIDDFCEKNKIIPKCMKIDIEGAEYIAIKGMKKTLKTHLPDLVLETHGYEINAIGGSLHELMKLLESYGYDFFDLRRGKHTTTSEYALRSPNISTIFASVKLKNKEFIFKLQKNAEETPRDFAEPEETKRKDFDVAQLANAEAYHEIIERLRDLPIDSKNAYEQYYLALSLQVMGFDYQQALTRYTHCLENLKKEFSPFWVYYNRGSLYYKLGYLDKALEDLNKAKSIYPNHSELKSLLTLIKEGKSKI